MATGIAIATRRLRFLAGTPGPFVLPMLRLFDRISYGLQTDLEAAVRAGEGRLKFDSSAPNSSK